MIDVYEKDHFKLHSFGKIKAVLPVPKLISIQVDAYVNFLQKDIAPKDRKPESLQSAFTETFPIESSDGECVLEFVEYSIDDPKKGIWECKMNGATYSVSLKALIRLINTTTGEVREQEAYMGELPMMTPTGSFIINGAERTVVNQLHRSPGVFIFYEHLKGLHTTRIIPDHKGSWLEFELDTKGFLIVRIDRRKKFPFTILVRALGHGTDEEVLRLFYKSERVPLKTIVNKIKSYVGRRVIKDVVHPKTKELLLEAGQDLNEDTIDILKESGVSTVELIVFFNNKEDLLVIRSLEEDEVKSEEAALIEFLKLHRPLEYITDHNNEEKKNQNIERAKAELNRLFFDPKTYNMGKVGRYKINAKFAHLNPEEFNDKVTMRTLRPVDILETVKYMVHAVNEVDGYVFDDIDHLGNRRIRTVDELLTLHLKTGFARMERVVKERMSMNDVSVMTPQLLLSIKPITAVINEFFGGSQLSQFMDQINPLADLTHKRRLNALGPGGLTRERAGFEVRDVHYTHYGRLCPIETPEGPNIGLIASLAVYARLNDYGFIETPYRVIKDAKASGKVVYLSANEEDHYSIAQANSHLNEKEELVDNFISCRYQDEFPLKSREEVQLMDVSPLQVISLSTSLIPFLEHDDANRALMGSNMQRQAVPLLFTEPALVSTGIEKIISYDSKSCVCSEHDGVVVDITGDYIVVRDSKKQKEHRYELLKYKRTNQSTCINQVPIVKAYFAGEDGTVKSITNDTLTLVAGSREYCYPLITFQSQMEVFVKVNEKVSKGGLLAGEKVYKEQIDKKGNIKKYATILADGHASSHGRLSLGKNVRVAFMSWGGYNFEDAIILSESLVRNDTFTSVIIEEFEIQARETKLGKGVITRDIPNIDEKAFRDLDEDGIIRIGASVQAGDVLVGMVTPKRQTDMTPEYRLLHSIFGEKAKEVKDSSLRVPNGFWGVVVGIKKFSRELGDELPPGISESVKVFVAQKRRVSVGDKMAGRHGNKGVVSVILPEHDMPFLEDGTPIDIILNPLGVPSRMNIGQIFETQLGWVAEALGVHFETPVFDGARWEDIQEYMGKSNLPKDSKVVLRDGKTGEAFYHKVFVGIIYMVKLAHMAEDKMHARSIGPYSLVTQQPLGGKAQFGGQRMGEMEVWALEAYGAAYTLQELLTVKSDDMMGRARVYESIVKGIHIIKPGIPQSFNVLMKEIRSLAIDISVIDSDNESVEVSDVDDHYVARNVFGTKAK